MKYKQSLLTGLLTSIVIFGISTQVVAQNTVRGKIVSSTTNEPISFANVVITSNYKGLSSNLHGAFDLKVKDANLNDTIRITAVGYETKFYAIKNYINKENVFKLKPTEFNLDNVTIQAKSLFPYRVIKIARERMEQNYWNQKLLYKAYYRNKVVINNTTSKERQAALRIYDDKGYGANQHISAFADINYDFEQVKRDFKVGSFSEASTRIDEMLEYDIMRTGQNIMHADTGLLQSLFDAELVKVTEYEGAKVWVLSYKCLEPSIATTGDYYATAYSGTLYVKQDDYAVVRNVTKVQASNYSSLGRSTFVDESTQEAKPLSISYEFITTYAKRQDHYFLHTVQCSRTHKWKQRSSGREKVHQIQTELMVNEVIIEDVPTIEGRAYYEEMQYDPAFWKNYNYLKDEE